MKPVYLEFCGIHSFSERTEIDFRALLAGGVFGIFGDTGSGKSTILDCIHLALYGKIERSEGSMNDCIHYNLDSAYVVFDFEITTEGVRHIYRVRRERKRKSGSAKALLYEYTPDGGLLALAEGTRDVDRRLEEIIGLTFDDFKMCIALPQGDFAALVKAPTSERVKLVSRLFDLEKYGEKLTKTANEKYYRAEEEVNLVRAKMEQNDIGGEETVAQKLAEIEELKKSLLEAEQALKTAETALDKATALDKEKREYDEAKRKLFLHEQRLPEMLKKREQTERIPLAKAVKREADALENNRREMQSAERLAKTVQEELTVAQGKLDRLKQTLLEENFDEKIVNLSVTLDKIKGAEKELKAERDAETLLNKCVEEYKRLNKACEAEDFTAQAERLEKEIEALGEDETLLDYLKHNCKDLLLVDAYGEVRKDLRGIAEKYPQTQADIEALLKKYTLGKADGVLDIAEINLRFKQTEKQRKALKTQLTELEKRKHAYELNEQKKESVKEQGKLYREALKVAQEKTAQIRALGDFGELQTKLSGLQALKAKLQADIDKTQDRSNALRAEYEKQSAFWEKARETDKELSKSLDSALKDNGFSCVEEAKRLLDSLGDEQSAKTACKEFFDGYEFYKRKCGETDEKKFDGYDDNALGVARAQKQTAQTARDSLQKRLAAEETEYKRLVELREKYRAFEKELAEKEKTKKLCDELRALLRGNRFLEYIASEYLQEICTAASRTLLSLTGGRYFLRYDKEFKVGDNLDGGNLRAVKTLSGGETFLVSLSLALSLSAAICQKSLRPIEFFFLDEGFGTLDDKLVDTVMDVLGKLSKTFAVGLISHVEELKHRIDNKLLVAGATKSSGSKVRVERF